MSRAAGLSLAGLVGNEVDSFPIGQFTVGRDHDGPVAGRRTIDVPRSRDRNEHVISAPLGLAVILEQLVVAEWLIGDLAFGHAEEHNESASLGPGVAANVGLQRLLHLWRRQPGGEGNGHGAYHLCRSDIASTGADDKAAVSRLCELDSGHGATDSKTPPRSR